MKVSLPAFCALASISIAAISVIGWACGIDRLSSVVPGLPQLVPMTATLTFLACAALWRQWRAVDAGAPDGNKAGLAPAALLALLSVAVGLCHALELAPAAPPPPLSLSLDSDGGATVVSLSSPVTTMMFAMLAVGLLCMLQASWLRCGQWLALGVLLLAMLTCAGYSFRDTYLYEQLPGSGTSILTTLILLLLSTGVLALQPRRGIMIAVSGPTPGAWLARRLLLSALAMPVLLGGSVALLLRADVIDVGTAIALLVWGMIALFTAVVWRLALQLYRIDEARRAAETQRESALAALREADVRKDDFLAMLAHELRNPLAPIRAGADLLRLSAAGNPQLSRTSGIIARQVDHMTHLVDDLLDVSRVTRGLITLERVPVDVHRAVCDAVEQARPAMAQRGHRMHTDLQDLHPEVLGDHKRLVQVVANLLNNAAKYTPEGGEIRVSLRADAQQVEVEVRDNGIGMDDGLLPRVFDIFTQATRTAGRADGGLGLGLALVKRLTELHGGTVKAASEGPGRGSQFTLTLPRMQAPPLQQAPAALAASIHPADVPTGRP